MTTLTDEELENIQRECQTFIQRLAELGVDSTSLMITFGCKDGFTGSRVFRQGNYWAQRGLVSGWLESVRDEEKAKAIATEVILTDEE